MTGTVAPQAVRPASQVGGADGVLTEEQVRAFVHEQLAAVDLDGRSVCVLVPDGTRSCPMPLLLGAVHEALHGRVTRLTVLIALGTHARDGERPSSHATSATRRARSRSAIPARRCATTSGGTRTRSSRSARSAPSGSRSCPRAASATSRSHVRLNRAVVEHDVTLVVGPVFPHEVVGFSGGNKYFFPGVSGQEIIDVSHWLGALITSAEIIGTRGITPVRALIDEAVVARARARSSRSAWSCSRGRGRCTRWPSASPQASWAAAADVAAETHVRYLDAPVRRVLSIVPTMYDDIWTGGEGLLQGRAGRRRRRRGGDLRAAHHARSPRRTRRSTRSATTAATTS